jgi:hypothetical protein
MARRHRLHRALQDITEPRSRAVERVAGDSLYLVAFQDDGATVAYARP